MNAEDCWDRNKCLICQLKCFSDVAKERHVKSDDHLKRLKVYEFLNCLDVFAPTSDKPTTGSAMVNKKLLGEECTHEFLDAKNDLKFWICSTCYIADKEPKSLESHLASNAHRLAYIDIYHPARRPHCATGRELSAALDEIAEQIRIAQQTATAPEVMRLHIEAEKAYTLLGLQSTPSMEQHTPPVVDTTMNIEPVITKTATIDEKKEVVTASAVMLPKRIQDKPVSKPASVQFEFKAPAPVTSGKTTTTVSSKPNTTTKVVTVTKSVQSASVESTKTGIQASKNFARADGEKKDSISDEIKRFRETYKKDLEIIAEVKPPAPVITTASSQKKTTAPSANSKRKQPTEKKKEAVKRKSKPIEFRPATVLVSDSENTLLWCEECGEVLVVDMLRYVPNKVWYQHQNTEWHLKRRDLYELFTFDEMKFISGEKASMSPPRAKPHVGWEEKELKSGVTTHHYRRAIVGLEHMVERYTKRTKGLNDIDIVCRLCLTRLRFQHSDVADHVSSEEHLMKYLHRTQPQMIKIISKATTKEGKRGLVDMFFQQTPVEPGAFRIYDPDKAERKKVKSSSNPKSTSSSSRTKGGQKSKEEEKKKSSRPPSRQKKSNTSSKNRPSDDARQLVTVPAPTAVLPTAPLIKQIQLPSVPPAVAGSSRARTVSPAKRPDGSPTLKSTMMEMLRSHTLLKIAKSETESLSVSEQPVELQSLLDNAADTLIGVQRVYEVRAIGDSLWRSYYCESCGIWESLGRIADHLSTEEHMITYMDRYYKFYLRGVQNGDPSQRSALLRQYGEMIRQSEGPQRITRRVKFLVNVNALEKIWPNYEQDRQLIRKQSANASDGGGYTDVRVEGSDDWQIPVWPGYDDEASVEELSPARAISGVVNQMDAPSKPATDQTVDKAVLSAKTTDAAAGTTDLANLAALVAALKGSKQTTTPAATVSDVAVSKAPTSQKKERTKEKEKSRKRSRSRSPDASSDKRTRRSHSKSDRSDHHRRRRSPSKERRRRRKSRSPPRRRRRSRSPIAMDLKRTDRLLQKAQQMTSAPAVATPIRPLMMMPPPRPMMAMPGHPYGMTMLRPPPPLVVRYPLPVPPPSMPLAADGGQKNWDLKAAQFLTKIGDKRSAARLLGSTTDGGARSASDEALAPPGVLPVTPPEPHIDPTQVEPLTPPRRADTEEKIPTTPTSSTKKPSEEDVVKAILGGKGELSTEQLLLKMVLEEKDRLRRQEEQQSSLLKLLSGFVTQTSPRKPTPTTAGGGELDLIRDATANVLKTQKAVSTNPPAPTTAAPSTKMPAQVWKDIASALSEMNRQQGTTSGKQLPPTRIAPAARPTASYADLPTPPTVQMATEPFGNRGVQRQGQTLPPPTNQQQQMQNLGARLTPEQMRLALQQRYETNAGQNTGFGGYFR